MVSARAKEWIALWTVYIIWGSTYLGIELTGETIPPLFAVAVRFIVAGALMAGLVAWRRGASVFRVTRPQLLGAILVGLLLPGANALLFVAERHVETGLSSLIIGAVPLWVVLLRLGTGDQLDRLSILGVVVGFAGLAVLVNPGHGDLEGLLLVVASSVAWAVGSFLAPRIALPRDALAGTTLQMLAGGIALLPVGLVASPASGLDPSHWSARSIGGFWYLVVFGSIVGYTAYAWLLANVPIAKVSTYAYVNPVVAIALGAIVLSEPVTWRIALGAAIVLASVALVVGRESRPEVAAEGESFSGAASAGPARGR
jgi:drug/metabolite transporter (DMT)-like permease